MNWHIHKWGKWEVVKEGMITRVIDNTHNGYFFLQEKENERCGKKQWEHMSKKIV